MYRITWKSASLVQDYLAANSLDQGYLDRLAQARLESTNPDFIEIRSDDLVLQNKYWSLAFDFFASLGK